MSLENLKQVIPDYAKDLRVNIESVLSPEGAPGLTQTQIYGIFLASAYATKNEKLSFLAAELTQNELDEAEKQGVKAAVSIMGMNNIYYRYLHLLEEHDELKQLPAKLRMTVIGRPGVEKVNFELYSLAVSSITGCGMCINAHVHEVKKSHVENLGIQSAIRIAAVTHGIAQALHIG